MSIGQKMYFTLLIFGLDFFTENIARRPVLWREHATFQCDKLNEGIRFQPVVYIFFGFGEYCASFDRSTLKFTPGGRVEGAPI
jgi:hypothetical protein